MSLIWQSHGRFTAAGRSLRTSAAEPWAVVLVVGILVVVWRLLT